MTSSEKGINKQIVSELSQQKNEPSWMLDLRLKAISIFESKKMPTWGPDLSALDVQDIHYFVKATEKEERSWDNIPEKIKKTFDALGIIKAEQHMLAGVGAQYESEMVYKNLQKKWSDQGVIFCSMDQAVILYPDLVKKYFGTVIPASDNIFAALNSAVWSGGSFVYVPAGVIVDMPLQAYFRINQERMGQFERTLIIAEPGSSVHYVEGCSAPIYQSHSLHSAVVEIIALEGSSVRYTTIQNWSNNVYNLVTKRAVAYKNARVEWVDGNFGSKVTMKYPCIILKEPGARGQTISIAVASECQVQDSGAKMIHLASDTQSHIIAKSISQKGGQAIYRGLIKVVAGARRVKVSSECDALLLDDLSSSCTYPTIESKEQCASIEHEATVSSLSEAQLFYLESRGLTKQEASGLLVHGFIEVFVDKLPMEYAVEINRLIMHQMEGSIG